MWARDTFVRCVPAQVFWRRRARATSQLAPFSETRIRSLPAADESAAPRANLSTALYGNNFRLLEALEIRKEGRDLERPFLSGRLQHWHFRLLHLDLVGPWIHLDAGAERQGSDLIGPIHSQALGSLRNGLHSDEMTAAEIV